MLTQKSYIDSNGRLIIPAKIRHKLKLKTGDEVSIKCNNDNLVISTFSSNIEKVRNILTKYENINLQDELQLIRKEDNAKE